MPPTKPTLLRDAAAVLGLVDRVVCAAASFDARAPHFADATASAAGDGGSASGGAGSSSGRSSRREEEAAAAQLFLAAKMCEEPRRLRDVLNSVEVASHGDIIRDAYAYWDRKSRMMACEMLLLRELGFDTGFEDAQVLLLNSLRLFRAPKALYELSVALLNDATTQLREPRPSRVLVAAAIGLAAEMLALPLPTRWPGVLEVEAVALSEASHAILAIYDEPAGMPLEPPSRCSQ